VAREGRECEGRKWSGVHVCDGNGERARNDNGVPFPNCKAK